MRSNDGTNPRKNRALPTWWPECDIDDARGTVHPQMWQRKLRDPPPVIDVALTRDRRADGD